jgi:hypothetical protein
MKRCVIRGDRIPALVLCAGSQKLSKHSYTKSSHNLSLVSLVFHPYTLCSRFAIYLVLRADTVFFFIFLLAIFRTLFRFHFVCIGLVTSTESSFNSNTGFHQPSSLQDCDSSDALRSVSRQLDIS